MGPTGLNFPFPIPPYFGELPTGNLQNRNKSSNMLWDRPGPYFRLIFVFGKVRYYGTSLNSEVASSTWQSLTAALLLRHHWHPQRP